MSFIDTSSSLSSNDGDEYNNNESNIEWRSALAVIINGKRFNNR